jgi:hypothetical protein
MTPGSQADLPLDVRQRLHSQMLFALPVIAIVPVRNSSACCSYCSV